MKKILIIILIFASSCSKDLENLNRDIKNATTAAPGTFFSNALKDMADVMNEVSYTMDGPGVTRLFAQHLTSVTYIEGTIYVAEAQYDRGWRTIYSGVLKDLEESAKTIRETLVVGEPALIAQKNQLAIIEIMKVYGFSILVEGFGNIPYTEALDVNNVLPKYDDGLTVYTDLISRLSAAIDNLVPTGAGFESTADLIYQGNVGKWKKFANSLKLKMGLRIIDKDQALGAATVTSAIQSGVFTSNLDNAVFKYLDGSPNTNAWWVNLVQNSQKYFVATDVIVNPMNAMNDPRRAAFFSTVNGQYVGGKYGVVQNYDPFSHMGTIFYAPTLPTIILDYATVEFCLAEAAERGVGSVTNPEAHYNEAIKASMAYYGIPAGDANTYLAQPSVAYSTADGTWQQKIGTQKWIALFNQGYEAWTEYRRLDYPVLHAPDQASIDIVPTRFMYPFDEQTLNGTNYEAAASAIGGDLLTTKLFWDVH